MTFRRAVDERLLYGRSCESIAAATIYVAVRTGGVMRRLAEIVAVSSEPRRLIARDARHLQRELGLPIEPPSVVEYLPRIRTALRMDERTGRRARRLLEAAVEANVHSGRDPNGLAASALYTVSLLDDRCRDRCQTTVAEAADVTPETIRERHRELRELCPDVFGVETSRRQPSTLVEIRPDGSANSSSRPFDRLRS